MDLRANTKQGADAKQGAGAALRDGVSAQHCMAGLVPVLDRLCPMHLVIAHDGTLVHAGPTLARLRAQDSLVGQGFLDLFEITRPRNTRTLAQVFDSAGSVLRLNLRASPCTAFKGQLVPYADGAVVNLSFGISILDAVRDYALSSADFAATDMTVEIVVTIIKHMIYCGSYRKGVKDDGKYQGLQLLTHIHRPAKGR